MIQLLLHLWGDYITQSDWMAQNKTKSHSAAFCHALMYSIPFALIGGIHRTSWNPKLIDSLPLFVIFQSHYLIDRYRLARYVVWTRNWLGIPPRYAKVKLFNAAFQMKELKWIREGEITLPAAELIEWRKMPWEVCQKTGSAPELPDWLATFILIVVDNTLHLTINYCALRWL